MSNCVFIASDRPLPEVRPSQDYPLHINLDAGTISDGGADDNYSLLAYGGGEWPLVRWPVATVRPEWPP